MLKLEDYFYEQYKLHNPIGLTDFYISAEEKSQNTERCIHMTCSDCNGTGIKINGQGSCIHFISCPCPKCIIRF